MQQVLRQREHHLVDRQQDRLVPALQLAAELAQRIEQRGGFPLRGEL
ncbi:MAG: hypothetical protein M5U05_12705 [Anaerolineales bacterium]|nr:hypothetical protein [Anaerolineales bacterium]